MYNNLPINHCHPEPNFVWLWHHYQRPQAPPHIRNLLNWIRCWAIGRVVTQTPGCLNSTLLLLCHRSAKAHLQRSRRSLHPEHSALMPWVKGGLRTRLLEDVIGGYTNPRQDIGAGPCEIALSNNIYSTKLKNYGASLIWVGRSFW